MERRRMLINAGFSLFPALLSAVYYVIVSAGRLENVPQPTELGSKVLASLLEFPNSEWVDLGSVRLFLLLVSLVFLCRGIQGYHKAAGGKEKEAELADIAASILVSLCIIVLIGSPRALNLFFSALQAVEGNLLARTAPVLDVLKEAVVFIVPMTALTLLRYFFLALMSIILPLALVLFLAKETRELAKIILEQAFIWTFASEIALALLVIVAAFAAIPTPAGQIPTLCLALISAAIIVIAPPITLKILEVLEKILDLIRRAVAYEYKETYGKRES
jgi:hypothetical protein